MAIQVVIYVKLRVPLVFCRRIGAGKELWSLNLAHTIATMMPAIFENNLPTYLRSWSNPVLSEYSTQEVRSLVPGQLYSHFNRVLFSRLAYNKLEHAANPSDLRDVIRISRSGYDTARNDADSDNYKMLDVFARCQSNICTILLSGKAQIFESSPYIRSVNGLRW